MKNISILIIFIVFIYGIIEMNKSANICKKEGYCKLSADEKRLVIYELKNYWKTYIIFLAIIFSMALIVLSTYMGKGTNYENIIVIGTIIMCIIIFIGMLFSRRRFYDNVNRYFS